VTHLSLGEYAGTAEQSQQFTAVLDKTRQVVTEEGTGGAAVNA
jgi:hypothetical protein